MLRLMAVLLVLLPLVGCEATSTGAVREGGDWNESTAVFIASPLRAPVYVSDEEFATFMWKKGRRASFEEFKDFMEELGVHIQVASYSKDGRVLLVSWEPRAGGGPVQAVQDYLRWCQPLDRCISLPEDSRSFGPETRQAIALNIALRSVWPGVVEALHGMADIHQLEMMVVSTLAVYLALVVAPEPVSKLIAAKLTYVLLGYLGVSTLWDLVDGWKKLEREVGEGHSFEEIYAAGDRFGKRIGAQVARVLVMLVTWRLGGKIDGAMAEMQFPGGTVASRMMAMEGSGLGLSTTGAVRSMALGEGRIAVAFSGAVGVATEQGFAQREKEIVQEKARPQQRPSRNAKKVPVVAQVGGGENDCKWHHIGTDKNEDSDVRGGPWTPRFREIFERAGMSLDDPENLVCIAGHKGPHPEEYHKEVYRLLDEATSTCRNTAECRQALTATLQKLAKELSTPGTRLNGLVTVGAAR